MARASPKPSGPCDRKIVCKSVVPLGSVISAKADSGGAVGLCPRQTVSHPGNIPSIRDSPRVCPSIPCGKDAEKMREAPKRCA